MKYLMSINEFFQLPNKFVNDFAFNSYKDKCKKDFEDLYTDEDFEKIIKILERDCSDFLAEMFETESILFRGAKSVPEVIKGLGKKESRVDRFTVDMRQDVSYYFDNLFEDKFGIRLRSNGVFATKLPMNALGYSGWNHKRKRVVGYMFFPIGEYRYFWNPRVQDLYSDIENEFWYSEYEFVGDEYSEGYLEDLWWEIYGEPGKKIGPWSTRGGGQGEYLYKGKPTGFNTIPRIIGLLRDNPQEWGVDPDIFKKEGDDLVDELEKDLTWNPEKDLDEYKSYKSEEVSNAAHNDMSGIVSGYREGDLKDIKDQEITFICKEYYLVEDAFMYKMIDYLNQNISKLSDNSHSE